MPSAATARQPSLLVAGGRKAEHAGGTKIIQALCALRAVALLHGLQRNHDRLPSRRIDEVLAREHGVVDRGHAPLRFDLEASPPSFIGKRFLVDIFHEASSAQNTYIAPFSRSPAIAAAS